MSREVVARYHCERCGDTHENVIVSRDEEDAGPPPAWRFVASSEWPDEGSRQICGRCATDLAAWWRIPMEVQKSVAVVETTQMAEGLARARW